MTNAMIKMPSIVGRHTFDQFFDQIFDDPFSVVKKEAGGYPLTDLYTDEVENQVIEMALAGFKREEINIEVKDNSITISCSSDTPAGDPRRIARRAFKRSFVDYDQKLEMKRADATFENGLLQVVIPRVEEAQPTIINIQ
tara:strand:+ start:541 stop:960 length:420 start_codon:yes stop_codon:yes gene_type:complete